MARVIVAAAFSVILAMLVDVSPALAEGPVTITQAKALQGGITPADGPGFPIEIHGGGSFVLDGDILVPNDRNGIVVYDDHVTIDLGGFTLRSASGSQAKSGISGPASYLTVRNGTIGFFQNGGIYYTSSLKAGDFWKIEDLTITNTHFAVHTTGAVKGKGFLFRNNTLLQNYIGVECGDYCQIEDSTISITHQAGIRIGSGGVLGNTIMNNGVGIAGDAATPAGYGYNTIGDNAIQVQHVVPMTPNACTPAC